MNCLPSKLRRTGYCASLLAALFATANCTVDTTNEDALKNKSGPSAMLSSEVPDCEKERSYCVVGDANNYFHVNSDGVPRELSLGGNGASIDLHGVVTNGTLSTLTLGAAPNAIHIRLEVLKNTDFHGVLHYKNTPIIDATCRCDLRELPRYTLTD